MTRLTIPLVLMALLSCHAGASTLVLEGTLSLDNQIASVLFTTNSTEVVTVQSYGYAGGTVNSTVISEGGFDPGAFIFDNTGQLIADYSGSGCMTGADAVTGNCADPYIQQSFAPGQYTLVLTVANNFPNDTSLADGFQQDGAGSYTCAPYGETGNFCDVSTATGTPRNGDWAVAITGADSASLPGAPEPAGFYLLAISGAALALRKRRRGIA
jgi:hypothetical protein